MSGLRNLEEFLSSISEAVWSYDITGKEFTYFNQPLTAIFETNIETLKKDKLIWKNSIHPDDVKYVFGQNRAALAGKETYLEYRIIINNKIKWISDKRKAGLDEAGKPQTLTGIVVDITERKEAERRLEESERTYRYLFMNNPNPLWIYDVETFNFLAVNDAAIQHYGYTADEFLSMTILDIRAPDEVSRLLESVKALPERYNSSHYWQHTKKDGSLIYVNIAGHRINYNGKAAEIVLVDDVTGEIKGQQEVVAAKNNIDTLINTTQDLIWSVDRNFCIISLNFAFLKYHKFTTGNHLKPGDSIFAAALTVKSFSLEKKNYERAFRGESFAVVEKTFFQNKEITVEVRYNPIVNEDGEVTGVACFSRDISVRIMNEEKITSQNRKLKEITSIASHDFRGPIASLIGLVNLFNKKDYSDAFNARIIDGIEETAYKLDNVVHRIVNKTFEVELQEASLTHSAPQNQ